MIRLPAVAQGDLATQAPRSSPFRRRRRRPAASVCSVGSSPPWRRQGRGRKPGMDRISSGGKRRDQLAAGDVPTWVRPSRYPAARNRPSARGDVSRSLGRDQNAAVVRSLPPIWQAHPCHRARPPGPRRAALRRHRPCPESPFPRSGRVRRWRTCGPPIRPRVAKPSVHLVPSPGTGACRPDGRPKRPWPWASGRGFAGRWSCDPRSVRESYPFSEAWARRRRGAACRWVEGQALAGKSNRSSLRTASSPARLVAACACSLPSWGWGVAPWRTRSPSFRDQPNSCRVLRMSSICWMRASRFSAWASRLGVGTFLGGTHNDQRQSARASFTRIMAPLKAAKPKTANARAAAPAGVASDPKAEPRNPPGRPGGDRLVQAGPRFRSSARSRADRHPLPRVACRPP